MNYAFDPMHYDFNRKAPPPYDDRMRKMFERRANTTLAPRQKGLSSLKNLIDGYLQGPSVTRPIDDLVLGGHGSEQGKSALPMFPAQSGPTTYERLQETIDTLSKSVTIPATVTDPAHSHYVRLKGCNMGKAKPFLVKMKEALGTNVAGVTAPKHFHALAYDANLGVFEHMEYQFSIRSPTDLADRGAIVAAFAATTGFTFIDGTAPSSDDFEHWIPEGAKVKKGDEWSVATPLGTTIGERTTLTVKRTLVVDRSKYVQPLTYSSASQVPPPANRRSAFDAVMRARATFLPTHPLPMFKRLGYDTFDDFMNGYVWDFTNVKTTKTGVVWTVSGSRVQYTIIVPITRRDPATTGQLVFNFYPNAGSSFGPITNMGEADATYFETA